MALTNKRIVYPRGTVKELAKRFGVCENTVRYALKFLTDGEQPEAIRKMAVEEYGAAVSRITRKGQPKKHE